MAGFNININSGSNDPNNPTPIDPSQVKPESVQSLGKDKNVEIARIKLEKQLRDADRQAERVATRLKSQVLTLNAESQKALRGAKTSEEVDEILSSRFEKQINRVNQLYRDLDSAIDNARTRVKTSAAGKKSDMRILDDLEEMIQNQLENAPEQIQKIIDTSRDLSVENIETKEKEKTAKKKELEDAKQGRRERQQEERFLKRRADQVENMARAEETATRDKFILDNKEVLDTTFKENLIGMINNTLLMGRRGNFKTDVDTRKDELLRKAEEAAREAGDRIRKQYELKDPTKDIDEEARKRLGLPKLPPPPPGSVPPRKIGGPLPEEFTEDRIASFKANIAPQVALASVITAMVLGAINKVKNTVDNTIVGAGSVKAGNAPASTLAKNLPLGATPMGFLIKHSQTQIGLLEQIASSIEQSSIAFSPEILEASIDRQLAFLENDMQRGAELGLMTATIMRSQTRLELASRKFQDTLLELLGPWLVATIAYLERLIKEIEFIAYSIRSLISGVWNNPFGMFTNPIAFWTKVITDALIAANKRQDTAGKMLPEIDAFLRNQDPNDSTKPNPVNQRFM